MLDTIRLNFPAVRSNALLWGAIRDRATMTGRVNNLTAFEDKDIKNLSTTTLVETSVIRGKHYVRDMTFGIDLPRYKVRFFYNDKKDALHCEFSLPSVLFGTNGALVDDWAGTFDTDLYFSHSLDLIEHVLRMLRVYVPLPLHYEVRRLDICQHFTCDSEAETFQWLDVMKKRPKRYSSRIDPDGTNWAEWDNGLSYNTKYSSCRVYNKGYDLKRQHKAVWGAMHEGQKALAFRTLRFEMTFRPEFLRYQFWQNYLDDNNFMFHQLVKDAKKRLEGEPHRIMFPQSPDLQYDDPYNVRQKRLQFDYQSKVDRWVAAMNKTPIVLSARTPFNYMMVPKDWLPEHRTIDLTTAGNLMLAAFRRFIEEYSHETTVEIHDPTSALVAAGYSLMEQLRDGLISKSTYYRRKKDLGTVLVDAPELMPWRTFENNLMKI